jgi:hypothetical protein
MKSTWSVPTDQENKLTVESQFNFIMWSQGRAYAGFEAEFELRTILVGDGAKVKVTCRTQKGKKLDTVEGAMFRNRFRGAVVIPEKVKVDDYVYLEAELPKLKLDGESNLIPVRPPIEVSSIEWDKKVIHRDEEVKMTCVFTNGVEDDDQVNVIVYEYDEDGCHDKIVSFPTIIKNSKVELKWKFMYQWDTAEIPTEEELSKYGKSYSPPKYFFVVMADSIPVGKNQESGFLEFKDNLSVFLNDDNGEPCSDSEGSIMYPDGTEKDFTLDQDGSYKEDEVLPGRSKISFNDVNRVEYNRNKDQYILAVSGKFEITSGTSYTFTTPPFIFSK